MFQRAKSAVEEYKKEEVNEEEKLRQIINEIEKIEDSNEPTIKLKLEDVRESQEKFKKNTPLIDGKGNVVIVPGEFHVSSESGDTVKEGIIIEDDKGNQFVWIPVSNINGDNDEKNTINQNKNDLIKKDDNTEVEITLGRYTFSRTDGTPKLEQVGNNYESSIEIDTYCQEVETLKHTNGGIELKSIGNFINSVKKNHGYYIGRYEASFGSGTNIDNYKLAVKKSTSNSTSKMNTTSGTLWNYLTQINSATICKNMYKDNEDNEAEYVVSDLINSYAWDTAIVYIQKMGNNNYANQTRGSNNSLKNTGYTGDEKCHIFDMAGNLAEWTTEYSTKVSDGDNYPCVLRGGGCYSDDFYSSARHLYKITANDHSVGCRPVLYLK